MMNDLYSFYAQHRNTRVMHKWEHYFEIYERFLSPIRHTRPVVLEIGVQLGGSVVSKHLDPGPGAPKFAYLRDPSGNQFGVFSPPAA